MTIRDLAPAIDERMLIVGRTGSGKTTLARAILHAGNYPAILVIDSKCTYGGREGVPGYTLVRSPRALRATRARYVQYRPGPAYQSVDAYEEVYGYAYDRQEVMVYTDEVYLTMTGRRSPDMQRACITCGRELGVGMILSTQRPRGIDPRVRSEADRRAQFRLSEEEDRICVWGRMRARELPNPSTYEFLFADATMDAPRLLRLRIIDD